MLDHHGNIGLVQLSLATKFRNLWDRILARNNFWGKVRPWDDVRRESNTRGKTFKYDPKVNAGPQ